MEALANSFNDWFDEDEEVRILIVFIREDVKHSLSKTKSRR